MRRELPKPTNAELEILTVLWSIGSATVREVYEAISRRRPEQYSTTLKFYANHGQQRPPPAR
jgi:BlaI family transcriptional regulator, penicillinase repressor